MRNLIFLIALFCLSIAQTAWSTDLKIGFVNPLKVLDSASQVQEADARLKREFEPREQAIIGLQEEIKRMKERFRKNEAIMSETELSDLRRNIIASERDLKRDQDEFREDYNIRRSEELDKLQKKIYKAIENLADRENFDLILSDGVIIASKRVDITDKVLAELKRSNK